MVGAFDLARLKGLKLPAVVIVSPADSTSLDGVDITQKLERTFAWSLCADIQYCI